MTTASPFDLVRHHRANERIFLYAFDLIELNGDDLRRDPLEGRKATLQMIWPSPALASGSTRYMEGDGPTVFRTRLQARARRHRLKAEGLALPFRPLA
jgi:ATP-dependent DNA ligase